MSFDIQKMMQKAQELQDRMMKAQKDLESEEVIGSAGGGQYSVEITINGRGVVKRCNISEALMKGGEKAMLEDLTVAAFNNAKTKLGDVISSKMTSLGIPPEMINFT